MRHRTSSEHTHFFQSSPALLWYATQEWTETVLLAIFDQAMEGFGPQVEA